MELVFHLPLFVEQIVKPPDSERGQLFWPDNCICLLVERFAYKLTTLPPQLNYMFNRALPESTDHMFTVIAQNNFNNNNIVFISLSPGCCRRLISNLIQYSWLCISSFEPTFDCDKPKSCK
ncbi:hypothetical protein GJ496_003837 [Pomphorhynchus laevis]|nr:hypothetical protein GJ496_003837 [Pomphorhynchus laevis]